MKQENSAFSIKAVENNFEELECLAKFAQDLAVYDGHKATINAEKLQKALFKNGNSTLAFLGLRRGKPIGFIIAYKSFTIYHGERGLYVPGAYVVPEYRHFGYGVTMFKFLTDYALENGFDFMNWIVEENNEKANAI